MCKGRCYAYEELKRQLQDQCTTYLKLHPNKEIGKGRYTDKGYLVPNKEIFEYLRGGVISTMAVFEAFLSNIMAEAFDRIIYEHECCCGCTCSSLRGCSCTCEVSIMKGLESLRKSTVCMHAFEQALQCDAKPSVSSVAQRAHEVVFGKKSLEELLVGHRDSLVDGTPLLHSFDEAFSKLFEGKKGNDKQVISDLIFSVTGQQHNPINYLYLLNDEFHSKITISDKETLCAILRLWYGIRCISAHGVAHKTIERRDGALKDFPKCSKCNKEGDETVMLKDAGELCQYLDEMFGKPDLTTVQSGDFLKLKYFPIPSTIQNISVEELNERWMEKAVKLAERH